MRLFSSARPAVDDPMDVPPPLDPRFDSDWRPSDPDDWSTSALDSESDASVA